VKNIFVITLLLAMGFSLYSRPGFTEDSLRLGYVDMREVLAQSKAGKRVQARLEKLIKQKKSALAKEEQAIKTLREHYQKEQLTFTEKQKQQKQQEFQQKLEAFQKMQAEAQREVRQIDAEFNNRLFP